MASMWLSPSLSPYIRYSLYQCQHRYHQGHWDGTGNSRLGMNHHHQQQTWEEKKKDDLSCQWTSAVNKVSCLEDNLSINNWYFIPVFYSWGNYFFKNPKFIPYPPWYLTGGSRGQVDGCTLDQLHTSSRDQSKVRVRAVGIRVHQLHHHPQFQHTIPKIIICGILKYRSNSKPNTLACR